jgi:hypothetical protein
MRRMFQPAVDPVPVPGAWPVADAGYPLSCLSCLSCLSREAVAPARGQPPSEWVLHFGWSGPARPPLLGAPRWMAAISIERLQPEHLRSVEVFEGLCPVYKLDSCESRRGLLASAGELLSAMSAQRPGGGSTALRVDARDLSGPVRLDALSLRLRVWADAAAAPRAVQVRVQSA